MKKPKKIKGFTLIELLAVIVILAIILVIAVPQILGVITQAKKDSLASSVKMYASAIETDYLVQMTSATPPASSIAAKTACPDVADFSASNGTCCYGLEVDSDGVPTATVTIVGAGKFANLTATGPKDDVEVETTGTTAGNDCTP